MHVQILKTNNSAYVINDIYSLEHQFVLNCG